MQRPGAAWREARVKNRIRECRAPRLGVIAGAAAAAMFCATGVWAGASASVSEQQRLDQLTGQVSNLAKQTEDSKSEIKKIEQAITVAPPAEASAKPQTVGEHVGLLEKDFGDLKKDLQDNLGIHVHGLADASYEYNVNNPNTGGKGGASPTATGGSLNQLRVFDPNANSFGLTQGNIHIDRTVDGGVGFVTDFNFGNTANVLGLSTRYSNINPGGTSNTIVDPTQFYATYTIPVGSGINVMAGRFVTLLGEEVIPVYNNLNYNETRSLLFGFAIPFTHTGIRASYTFNDYAALTLGVNNGWDDISDNNDGKTVEGQIALNNKDKSLSLLFNAIFGPEQVSHSSSKRAVINPLITWKPSFVPNLTLIGEYDYGHESGPVSVAPATTSYGNVLNFLPFNASNGTNTINHGVEWQGFAGYVVYDVNDNLELATRGEWFSDPDGARTGLRQNLGEVTQTFSYKIPGTTGLLTRFEYRHDESSSHPFFSSAGFYSTGPSNGAPIHTYAGQDTLTAAAIYSW
jgi:Putative beta-barrel porin-2, OmpL-like. bbp2